MKNALILGLLFASSACATFHAVRTPPHPLLGDPIAPVEITVAPVHHPRVIRPYDADCYNPGYRICQSTT